MVLNHLSPRACAEANADGACGDPGDGFRIERIPGCTFGVRVHGLSLADTAALDRHQNRLYQAFLEHGMLVFPGQGGLTPEENKAFARRFGELDKTMPEITFSNRKKEGELLRPDEHQFKALHASEAWHTDHTFLPVAVKAASLFAEELPAAGGETEFCDMRAGYEALGAATQERIAGLAAYCSNHYLFARRLGVHPDDQQDGASMLSKGSPLYPDTPILRPLVKTHPETGRKSLFVTAHMFSIPGMPRAESVRLLDDLIDVACQAPRVYSHAWEVGDLVFWDQRCVLHRARPYDPTEPRKVRTTRVAGDPRSEAGLLDAVSPETAKEVMQAELAELKAHPDVSSTRLR